jgi:hypothetical protein
MEELLACTSTLNARAFPTAAVVTPVVQTFDSIKPPPVTWPYLLLVTFSRIVE